MSEENPADQPPAPPPPSSPPHHPAPYPAQYPAQGTPAFPVYVVPDHPRATAALVVGIVSIAGSFFCLPILAAPVAWVLGARARRQIRSAPQQWSGEGRATAGMVLGIIGTVLLVLALVALVIVIVVAANDPTVFDDTNTSV